MIDNQEKVHTQLHKFDKIICENINGSTIKPLYVHNMHIRHTSSIEYFSIQIISDSAETWDLSKLREYLTANNFNITYQGYPITGSYGKGKTLMVLSDIIIQSDGTKLEGMYYEFSITSDGSLDITHRYSQDTLSADYFYKVTDTVVKLQ